VTEGPTLLPRHGEDKRTKEVFALSLERMNPRLRRGFAPAMNRLDEPLSTQRIMTRPVRATVTCPVTVHVRNRYFSLTRQPLFCAGFHGRPPASTKSATESSAIDFWWTEAFFDPSPRCSLTLICSSLIQRLTLAAAFAAAFFMGAFW